MSQEEAIYCGNCKKQNRKSIRKLRNLKENLQNYTGKKVTSPKQLQENLVSNNYYKNAKRIQRKTCVYIPSQLSKEINLAQYIQFTPRFRSQFASLRYQIAVK